MVIAIDGPSGAGKSTVARVLAERLGYTYIDTGALYRAIGWKARQEGIDPADEQAMERLCMEINVSLANTDGAPGIYVDNQDVSRAIRTPEMGMMASAVSKSPAVRARLLDVQRELGAGGGVVMDGRDIGTVIFPDADVKFYLDASAEERGRRRYRELKEAGLAVDLATITGEIQERDQQDSGRDIAPLSRAADALPIDSSRLSVEDVVIGMLAEVAKRREEK